MVDKRNAELDIVYYKVNKEQDRTKVTIQYKKQLQQLTCKNILWAPIRRQLRELSSTFSLFVTKIRNIFIYNSLTVTNTHQIIFDHFRERKLIKCQ